MSITSGNVSGIFFASLVALGSGLWLVLKRWQEVTEIEITFYWLGGAAALLFLSIYIDIELLGLSEGIYGLLVGSLIGLGSGLWLMLKCW